MKPDTLQPRIHQIPQKSALAFQIFPAPIGYTKNFEVASLVSPDRHHDGNGFDFAAPRTLEPDAHPQNIGIFTLKGAVTPGIDRSKIFWFWSLRLLGLTRLHHRASVMSSTLRTDAKVRYISTSNSYAELFRRTYRSIMAVSKGIWRSFGALSCTRRAVVWKEL